jgi:hypothetical protein
MLRLLDQCGQFLSSIEQAGLNGGGRDGENLRALLNRLLVIVDEVDDLAVIGRQLQ